MISPRPWKVLYSEDLSEVWGIVDADGNSVIETDAGFYGPKAEDAEVIVRLVNEALLLSDLEKL